MFHGNHKADIVQFVGQNCPKVIMPVVLDIPGYRSDTITQISRLYASSVSMLMQDKSYNEHYLMTSDIDMIPLSDYWQPDFTKVTVWGHDLTGYGHYPCCYIGMVQDKWNEVMKLDSHDFTASIKRDLDTLPQAKSDDFYKFWFSDQDLITDRLYNYPINFIKRGQYSNGYARGRVDRGAWTLSHSEFIDMHCFHQLYFKQNQDKFDKTMELLTSIWPDEDFGWWIKYTEEFRKLTGHS